MSIPTMTNEQFALFIAMQTNRLLTLDKADEIYNWLQAKGKSPECETLTMTVPVSEEVYQFAKTLDKQSQYKTKKK